MSFSFIHDFQMRIYNLLSGNPEISSIIDKIYLSVVQDAKYPFILINILKIEDISRYHHRIYCVEFEICIFARDRVQGTLLTIADKITEVLKADSNFLSNYLIAGIKSSAAVFQRSQDLVTTKLSINYNVLLKKEV